MPTRIQLGQTILRSVDRCCMYAGIKPGSGVFSAYMDVKQVGHLSIQVDNGSVERNLVLDNHGDCNTKKDAAGQEEGLPRPPTPPLRVLVVVAPAATLGQGRRKVSAAAVVVDIPIVQVLLELLLLVLILSVARRHGAHVEPLYSAGNSARRLFIHIDSFVCFFFAEKEVSVDEFAQQIDRWGRWDEEKIVSSERGRPIVNVAPPVEIVLACYLHVVKFFPQERRGGFRSIPFAIKGMDCHRQFVPRVGGCVPQVGFLSCQQIVGNPEK